MVGLNPLASSNLAPSACTNDLARLPRWAFSFPSTVSPTFSPTRTENKRQQVNPARTCAKERTPYSVSIEPNRENAVSTDIKIPRLLTTKQLAEVTGLSVWTVWELVKKGQGPPHVKLGRGFRFPENAVGPWLDKRMKDQAKKGA